MTYIEFIYNIIDTRGQWNISSNEYFEGHHIIPKCLGGTGNPKQKNINIIWLYPAEHYTAHKLLALENPKNNKLVYAWEMMAYPKGTTNRSYYITEDDYAVLKKLLSQNKNPALTMKGKQHTETTKQKMSVAQTGKHHTIETKNKLKNIAKKRLATEAAKNKCASNFGNRFKGNKHTSETIDKLQKNNYRNKAVICIETQKVFLSASEAGRQVGTSKISICCNKQISTAGGYHWAWLIDLNRQNDLKDFIGKAKINVKEEQKNKLSRAVKCLELNKIYKNSTEAAADLKMTSANGISECCRRNRKTAGGYHWKFVNKEELTND